MPLVAMKDLIAHARANRYAVGAYQVVDSSFVGAVIAAAEHERAPAILGFVQAHAAHYDCDALFHAARSAARRASVPVALLFDHASDDAAIDAAIGLGCQGVMADFAALPFAANVAATRAVAARVHAHGLLVEGELGYVPGVLGDEAALHPGRMHLTDPEEAARFVAATGIDCLAVAVGNVHGHPLRAPTLELDRLEAVAAAVPVPLALHGGSGLAEEDYRALIERGVAKINYFTALSDVAAGAASAALADIEAGYLQAIDAVRAAVATETARSLQLFGASGQAPGALAACRRIDG